MLGVGADMPCFGGCSDETHEDEVKRVEEDNGGHANWDGPIKNRQTHDIIWAAAFVAFWIGMFVVAGIAVDKGNPFRLVYGSDR